MFDHQVLDKCRLQIVSLTLQALEDVPVLQKLHSADNLGQQDEDFLGALAITLDKSPSSISFLSICDHLRLSSYSIFTIEEIVSSFSISSLIAFIPLAVSNKFILGNVDNVNSEVS